MGDMCNACHMPCHVSVNKLNSRTFIDIKRVPPVIVKFYFLVFIFLFYIDVVHFHNLHCVRVHTHTHTLTAKTLQLTGTF